MLYLIPTTHYTAGDYNIVVPLHSHMRMKFESGDLEGDTHSSTVQSTLEDYCKLSNLGIRWDGSIFINPVLP